ncbi:zinc finger MYM-type protein 4 isoform X1 [Xenopus laevis]|uniref:Zinc finger MYM-type protein 4 isoform X1 n=2 Tax=Xenopus laevis TaxID=8355 RepID=A0A8J0UCI3_XENLA|nr:zinc finger MYM-type protein 4 isoform X1 [Xenopus laevis]
MGSPRGVDQFCRGLVEAVSREDDVDNQYVGRAGPETQEDWKKSIVYRSWDGIMDADTNHSLRPILRGIPYKLQNPKVPDESLLDENYFMNSEVLAGIPVIENEDEQDYLLKGPTSSKVHSQGSMEEDRTLTGHNTDSEREIHINNLRLKDLLPQLNKDSMLQTIRKDFSLARERESQEAYSNKEPGREGIFSREADSRLLGGFGSKPGQMEETSRAQLVTQAPDSNFRESSYSYSSKSPVGDSLGNSFSSGVRIKEEPMDEDYDKALAPPPLVDKIKDEPDNSEEYTQQPKSSEGELKISAVFSVSGSPLAPQLSSSLQSPITSPGASKSLPAAPAVPSTSVRVSCSGCKKILQKGQTAYQRKGSTQLFCSTLCLTGYTIPPARPMTAPRRICSSCGKTIADPKDVITAQFDNPSSSKDFCSQTCLSAYEIKKKPTVTIHTNSISTKCSVCLKNAVIRHEVNYQNVVHKLCSDACFSKFRSANNLTMNCCENCGGYCYSGSGQCHLLNIDGQCKKFCSSSCVTAFKQKSAKITPCALCKTLRSSAEMIENTNSLGRTELYCSVNCLSAYRVQAVTASGVQVQCNSCKTLAIPQYHLAMSDGSIRNFCSYNCVVSFQNLFNKPTGMNPSVVPLSQGQVIMSVAAGAATQAGNSTPSLVSATSTSSTSTVSNSAAVGLQRLAAQSQSNTQQQGSFPRMAVKLRCQHCSRLFATKPELLDYKGKMYQFCGKTCCDEYKKINMVLAMCEYCKIDKIIKEAVRFAGIEKMFCSEGCKLLYKHDLAKKWGNHCKMCSYCYQTSPKLVRNHFGGKLEEFCGEECMSKFTVLFYQMGKCDGCKRQGKLSEYLKWRGEVKHFCNLICILVFCNQQQSTTEPTPPNNTAASVPMVHGVPASSGSLGGKESTPVIANVVSLASAPAAQPSANSTNVLQGAVPTVTAKIIGDASTQTDALKLPSSLPPRLLKNKALLCKPITQTKATSCKPHTQHKECQTEGDGQPQILVLPVPVPIFIPVPMHLYTQYAPVPLTVPLPIPVPMLIPTTLDNADKIIDAIEDLKEKVPTDPFEADLLQMAEMIAEDEEKEKTLSHGDQGSTYSGDLESEAVSTPHSWEEELNHYTLKSNNNVQEQDAEQPSRIGTEQDVEADFPTEAFDQQGKGSSFLSRSRTRRKHRDGFPQPKRRGRKKSIVAVEPRNLIQGTYPGCSPLGSTLKYMYGVNAWKNWVRWKNTQDDHEELKFGVRPIKLKEDLLSCTFSELSYGLCQFIQEVQRPNGEKYNADSILYLCLGVQQYLFENGRIDNIFTEPYSRFMVELTKLLKNWHPPILPNGFMFSRIEEEHLWECKQLGAYSPIILLNTLLFFTTKYFQLKTVSEHQQLSFAYVMRRTKTMKYNTKTTYLRFMPPYNKSDTEQEKPPLGKRKRVEDEDGQFVMEMAENTDNPLRCPVRLYEFYLSKCSESVKQRNDVFYLQPERSCVPNSPMWFSTMPIDPGTLESMLTRILMVREVHEELMKAKEDSEAEMSD